MSCSQLFFKMPFWVSKTSVQAAITARYSTYILDYQAFTVVRPENTPNLTTTTSNGIWRSEITSGPYMTRGVMAYVAAKALITTH